MPGWLAVALGSALGGVARFGVALLAARWIGTAFPWGTLAVNVAGSLLIGWLAASLASERATERLFWMTGICGGFTTFSAFSLESLALLRQGEPGRAAAYVAASLMLCLAAVACGFAMGRSR